jgi:hypothetical protein
MWLDSRPGDSVQPGGWRTLTRWLPVHRTPLDVAEVRWWLGPQAERFLELCTWMHLLYEERNGTVAFRHVKLGDFCALPALFEIARWTEGGEPRLDQNPLGIDLTPYPPELVTHVVQSIGQGARGALV